MTTAQDPVRQVATFDDVRADPLDTLQRLCQRMVESGRTAMLVVRRDGQRAIVTEHDVVRTMGTPDGTSEWVTDIMTRELREVDGDEPIASVADQMRTSHIRHLVVVDGERVGIVSMEDLIEPLLG